MPRITAQRGDCLLKMLRDQEPLAQSENDAPTAEASRPGADELVDLTYFIARRPSVELYNSSCVAISGFHQHAGTEMASEVTSSQAHVRKASQTSPTSGRLEEDDLPKARQMI